MRHFRESAMGDPTLRASVDTPKPPIYHARLLFGGNTHSALAQLVEQMTVNHWVAGSSPAGGAKYIKPRIAWFFYFWRSAGFGGLLATAHKLSLRTKRDFSPRYPPSDIVKPDVRPISVSVRPLNRSSSLKNNSKYPDGFAWLARKGNELWFLVVAVLTQALEPWQ